MEGRIRTTRISSSGLGTRFWRPFWGSYRLTDSFWMGYRCLGRQVRGLWLLQESKEVILWRTSFSEIYPGFITTAEIGMHFRGPCGWDCLGVWVSPSNINFARRQMTLFRFSVSF